MKLLIHGCGYIGEVHLKSIVKFQLCDVALCDLNETQLKAVAERYGVKETYTSLDEALKHPFDGVVVCTPNFAHAGDLEKCVAAGLNVMMEKPMAESVQSAQRMVEACQKHGKFAFVAYCLRFAPPYQKMKEIVASGKLGKVFSIRASVAGKKAITDAKTNYRMVKKLGGGVISDFSHEIDYAMWFADKPVKAVQCFGAKAVHKDWDVLDTAELLIGCEDDLAVSIHMDFLQPYFGRSIEIYGTEGALRFRDNECLKMCTDEAGTWQDIDVLCDWEKVYRDEMVHFIDCLKTGKRPLVDEKEGLNRMELIEMCVNSAEANEL